MSNLPSSPREIRTPEFSFGLRFLVGVSAFLAPLLMLLATVGVISGRALAFSLSTLTHLWWLEFTRFLEAVFAVVAIELLFAGCFFITLALGDGVLALWRRFRMWR